MDPDGDSGQLSWLRRMNITIGVARGVQPPFTIFELNSNAIYLIEDFSLKWKNSSKPVNHSLHYHEVWSSLFKSTNSHLAQGIASFNLSLELKEEPSSFSAIADLFISKENEVKLSGSSKLTNSMNSVDKNGALTASDCVLKMLQRIFQQKLKGCSATSISSEMY